MLLYNQYQLTNFLLDYEGAKRPMTPMNSLTPDLY
jgi:hypothetical protein